MKHKLLLALIGLLVAYYYLHTVPPAMYPSMKVTFETILNHTADSPGRYRILAVWLVQPFTGDRSESSIAFAYLFAHFIIFPAMFMAVDAYFSRWLSPVKALLGTVVIGFAAPLMFFQFWTTSINSAIEIIFLCVALSVISFRPRHWFPILAVLTFIATLNRETAILIPLAYAATAWREPRWSTRSGVLLGTWAFTYAALRIGFGAAPESVPLSLNWAQNTAGGWNLVEDLLDLGFFFPIIYGYARGLRRASQFQQRLLPLTIFYAVLTLTFGSWRETRLLLPLFILMLPTALTLIPEYNPTEAAARIKS